MNNTIAITGTSGYSGRYIAHEAVRRGYRVLGLTNSPQRADDPAECHAPLCWEDENALTASLRGCHALINTYWVRFDHGSFSHSLAVDGVVGHGRSLRAWLRDHAGALGRRYASELARRR